MKSRQTLRIVSILLASSGFCLWLLQVYWGVTSPVLPYQTESDSDPSVESISNQQYAGSLQPGDKILTFNGSYVYTCNSLIDSPIYDAPRNTPFPVTYQREHTNQELQTNIVATNPSMGEIFRRSPGYLMALVFVITGIIILIGGVFDPTHILLGLAWLSVGVMYASWQGFSIKPLSIMAWGGIPVNVILLVFAHAVWPVNQLQRVGTRVAIGIISSISIIYALNFFSPGSPGFACDPLQTIHTTAHEIHYAIYYSTYVGMSLTPLALLYLMISAYRQTNNPFSRLQIRAIAWAMGFGFTAPVLISFFDTWGPFGDLTLFLTGIIPLTYLFVLYRGELLSIDRYLNRMIFVFIFFIFWIVIMITGVKSILSLQPQIDPALLALTVALPSLLAATFVRERLGLLVDLVLHGTHYDYETVVSKLGQSLAGVSSTADLAQVVVHQLPQALSIRHAGLWLTGTDKQFHLIDLVGHAATELTRSSLPPLTISDFPSGSDELEIKNLPFYISSDATPWQAILRLYADTDLIGIILLGTKFRESTYSQRDVRTLKTLVGWTATTATNLIHLAEQQQSLAREHRLMLALAENEDRLMIDVARELHDRGISALGIVRLMAEQERGSAIITAGLEQVISNLRELSNNRLSPLGLSQGLQQALEAMVETQRQLGLPVFLKIEASYSNGEPLSALVSRELFYIAQEAVMNALKHASASRIEISLARLDNKVRLAVRNDGQGFEVDSMLVGRETRGMGIMQARANRINGKLTITSRPDSGTEVTVSVEAIP